MVGLKSPFHISIITQANIIKSITPMTKPKPTNMKMADLKKIEVIVIMNPITKSILASMQQLTRSLGLFAWVQ